MGRILSRSLGNHAAVTTRRVKAEIHSAAIVVAAHASTSDVRFAAAASRVYEALCSMVPVAVADEVVGHASRFHAAHLTSGRAVTTWRKGRLYDSDLLAACGFDTEQAKAVFGAIEASAPDSTTDPGSGYLTAQGKVTGDAEKARTTWAEAAANRK